MRSGHAVWTWPLIGDLFGLLLAPENLRWEFAEFKEQPEITSSEVVKVDPSKLRFAESSWCKCRSVLLRWSPQSSAGTCASPFLCGSGIWLGICSALSVVLVDSECTGTGFRDPGSGLAATFIAGSKASESRACSFFIFDAPPKSPPSHLKHLQSWLSNRLATTLQTRSKCHSRLSSLNKRGFSAAVMVLSGTCRARDDRIISDVRIFHANATLGLV
jgi:hypothetical protein